MYQWTEFPGCQKVEFGVQACFTVPKRCLLLFEVCQRWAPQHCRNFVQRSYAADGVVTDVRVIVWAVVWRSLGT